MTRRTTRRDDLTPAERRPIDEQVYWETSLHVVEDSSASLIAGLEFPIVGGLVEMAQDHAIGTSIAMLQHPDDELRWTADVALVLRGKILAVVRLTPRGVDVTSFDTIPPLPAERVLPGRRASRGASIVCVDGSLDSTCYGLGIPLVGRDLSVVLDDVIRSTCEAMQHPDALDDVAVSFRGRFLAVIRHTPEGPIVTRFDLPDSSPGEPADRPARPRPQASPIQVGGCNRKGRSSSGSTITLSS